MADESDTPASTVPEGETVIYPESDEHAREVGAQLLAAADHPRDVRTVTDGPHGQNFGYAVTNELAERAGLGGGDAPAAKPAAKRRAKAAGSGDSGE
jgi:hypothetical protein